MKKVKWELAVRWHIKDEEVTSTVKLLQALQATAWYVATLQTERKQTFYKNKKKKVERDLFLIWL